jgi:hypothetical protein
MVIRKGNERYYSPVFFEILKNRISELKNVELPEGSVTLYFCKVHWFDFTRMHDKDKLGAARIYTELKKEFENKIISKIMDTGQFLRFYPPEFKDELEKRILKLKKA